MALEGTSSAGFDKSRYILASLPQMSMLWSCFFYVSARMASGLSFRVSPVYNPHALSKFSTDSAFS